MLSFAILELLHRKPLSGYELKKRFGGSIVFFWKANHSQIYPELKRMEEAGLVVSSRVTHEWRPTKRVYAITPEGEQTLKAWLRQKPKIQAVKDEMILKTFAFNLVPGEEAEAQLTHHQQLHEQRLEVYLKTKRQLEQRHKNLPETDDPIVFWNVIALEHCISFERMYIEWCGWALARQKDFLRRTATTSTEAERSASDDQVSSTGFGSAES